MSDRESQLLKKRAQIFLRHAEDALQSGEFDFACFSAEQAAQLFVKSTMLDLLGEVPRLHSVREMLGLLGESLKSLKRRLSVFVKKHRESLKLLEDAYVAARYLPSTYTREDAEILVKLAREVELLMKKVDTLRRR